MTTNYQRGYRGEKRARELLESWGYFVVESRGSRGPIDLVAVPTRPVARATDGKIRLIQVKTGESRERVDRGRLRSLGKKLEESRVLIEYWWFPPWQTQPLIEEVSWQTSQTPSRK